jgi:hypothetical protein
MPRRECQVLDARIKIFLKVIDHRGIVAGWTVDGFSIIIGQRALTGIAHRLSGNLWNTVRFYSHFILYSTMLFLPTAVLFPLIFIAFRGK